MHQFKNGPILARTPSMVLRFQFLAANHSSSMAAVSSWQGSSPKASASRFNFHLICLRVSGRRFCSSLTRR